MQHAFSGQYAIAGESGCAQFASAEYLLNLFVAGVEVGLAVFDQELRCQAINPWLASAYGVPPKHHLGKHLREIIGETAVRMEAGLRQTLTMGRPVLNFEFVGILPAGAQRTRWIGNFFPVKDKDGRVNHVAAIVMEGHPDGESARGHEESTTDSEHWHVSRDGSNPELLRSWKEIAVYLGTCSKTVQRWERGHNLPVHRVVAAKGAVVFALKSEVDSWMRNQSVRNLQILNSKTI